MAAFFAFLVGLSLVAMMASLWQKVFLNMRAMRIETIDNKNSKRKKVAFIAKLETDYVVGLGTDGELIYSSEVAKRKSIED